MPPSVTAVTAVTTADADERTRVRAAHATRRALSWRGAASGTTTADQLFRRSGRRVYHKFGGHAFVNVC